VLYFAQPLATNSWRRTEAGWHVGTNIEDERPFFHKKVSGNIPEKFPKLRIIGTFIVLPLTLCVL